MRRLTAAQTKALIRKYKPPRARLKFYKHRKWWKAYAQAHTDACTEIRCPYPDTPFMALVFLHECAHVHDRAVSLPPDHPDHHFEYAAERTAMCWWRNEGHTVPKTYLKVAKRYVRRLIRADRAAGHKIAPHVARWAKR